MTSLSIDIETYSSNDLRKGGVYKYVEAKDFEILLFAYAFDDDEVQVVDLCSGEKLPKEVSLALKSDCRKNAFNANFERLCLSRFLGVSPDPKNWHCTMVKAAMLGLPMDLKNTARVLQLEDQKSDEGKALIRYFTIPCKPTKTNNNRTRNLPEHAPEKWESFKAYNIQDVVTERAVDKATSWFTIPENEKILWNLDQKINDTGVKLNSTLIHNSISFDKTYKKILEDKAVKLTGLDNPNSVAQIKSWLADQDENVETLNKEAVANLLKSTNSEQVAEMMRLRMGMAKTSVKKYVAMANGICADGRLRGLLQFYGANRTGRWAGRLVQTHNLPRNNLKDLDCARQIVLDNDFEALNLIFDVSITLSELIRTAFVPSKNKQLTITDFSAIEARVLAWLAKERWRIDIFNTHGKIYEASAAQMFKVPIESIDKKSPLRQKGKIAELALGYGGGVNALITMGALKMGLTEEELPPLVHAFRAANPNIVRLWKMIENAAINAVDGQKVTIRYGVKFYMKKGCLVIKLPSGRELFYQQATLGTNRFGSESIVYYGMDQTSKKWKKQETYGGKLVENIVQAIARDLLANAMLKVDKAGYYIVMHVHDEIVIESDKDETLLKKVNDILSEPAAWTPGLPLNADGFIGDYYKKD